MISSKERVIFRQNEMFPRVNRAKILLILTAVTFVAMIIYLSSAAYSAANTVNSSKLGAPTRTTGVNETIPTQCASLTLTSIFYCTGSNNCNATGASELILGTANGETIRGQGGADCIVGGGGNDDIRGGNGADVCIGGPGNDVFTNCASTYP
jgi:Ca2+-binding RTX toxin-like protein